MLRIYDINPLSFKGKPKEFIKVLHPDDVKLFKKSIDSNLLKGNSTSIEYRVIHKDGSIHNIFAKGRIEFNDENKPIKYTGIVQDITERKKAEEHKSTIEQLRQLAQYVEKIRENERLTISRELHDDLGQALTSFKMDLKLIKQNISDDFVNNQIDNLSNAVDNTIKTVQRLTSQLRPAMIEDLGLVTTIEWYTKDFSNRYKIEIYLDLESDITISHDSSIIIFRIMQESLTNIARHSNATHVNIMLFKSGNNINFRISDNGICITEDKIISKKSYGINIMKERVASIGGTFEIYSENNCGTEISIVLPINYK